ncbi:MAG: DEAD/DEAH box helicase [Alphaproteobacteria bacterium]|nr:DEAD/DEAH box helicase [Alphaproteobacteria bacterium]
MSVAELLDEVRQEADPRVWTAAVKLAREGAVVGVGEEDDALVLHVKMQGRPRPHEVHLWPDEPDAGCDCDLPAPCVHVCAATIAVNKGLKVGHALPEAAESFQVRLRYDFTTDGARLAVQRVVLWPDGRAEPLDGTLSESNYLARRGDTQAELLLVQHRGGPLDEERLRRLLVFLEGEPPATLDGAPIRLSAEPVDFVIAVRDEGEDFRVGLYRPPGLDKLFLGAALRHGVLHPTSYGELPEGERRALNARRDDRVFGKDKVAWLVSDYLPRLRGFGLPVQIETTRLPSTSALEPRVMVEIGQASGGLRVRPVLVYGDPPVARVEHATFVKLGEVVPARDHSAERRIARAFEEETRLAVGFERVLPPEAAVELLTNTLPRSGVEVKGKVDTRRFRVSSAPVLPTLTVGGGPSDAAPPTSGAELPPGFTLDVAFGGADGQADPVEVLRAWRAGRSLVPLMDGGYAPLPSDWLTQHGALLEELMAARDAAGRVDRNATAALAELTQEAAIEAPPDLRRLRAWLEGDDGLPESTLPEGLEAELRPYQAVGVRWLAFLRQMDLHGVLADDMGLGKTVQTLGALVETPGPHLVVAPTSVLRNWAREAARFAPGLDVCVYHGPDRKLRTDADLVLTSYALLRLDRAALARRTWSYLVLDEAQAIKNPDSQTAKSASALQARHRLALTGTPVENRLEELWSLFRFLMPGLLGPRSSFRDRFERPIEAGDPEARKRLRGRVRPYVLRRLKSQVATDLPPLTEIVVRCTMSPAQRKVYEAVRDAARRDVWLALSDQGSARFRMEVLEALLRMRQACCDPSLLPGKAGDGVDACKLDELEEMLMELVVDDHKVLVFSQWTSLLDRVQPRLEALGIPWVRLDGSTRDRAAVVDRFQADDGPPVFLISLKAGGTGLNLTAADYVIHLDPWWNPAVERQATDRAHRIGQDKPVVSCKLVAEGTVEERILDLQEAKRGLADAALGDESTFLRTLDADELRSLFDAA